MRYQEIYEDAAPKTINWVPTKLDRRNIAAGEAAVVWVDVAKFDAAWSKDYAYLPKNGRDGKDGRIVGRYGRFAEWLKLGEPVEMPIVSLGPDYKRKISVVFCNGRHRFSWLRDHGATAIPVVTDVGDAADMRELYGARMDKTVIHEAQIDTYPYQDYMGNEFDLKLCWNPSPRQAKALIAKSERKQLRGLVVGADICVWDAYYVDHAEMEAMLGCDPLPQRKAKFFLISREGGYRIGYGSWGRNEEWFKSISPIARLANGGFNLPSPVMEQQLDELRGVRTDPGVQHFQDLMKDDSYTGIEKRLDRFKEFTKWLENNNYKLLGNGCFGMVFTRADLPYAIKIFKNDPAYLKFVTLCLGRQSDPHLPKFRGKIMSLDNHFAVRMEKLIELEMMPWGLKLYADRSHSERSEDFISEQKGIVQKQFRLYGVEHELNHLQAKYDSLEDSPDEQKIFYDTHMEHWNALHDEKDSLNSDLAWSNSSDMAEDFLKIETEQKGILDTIDFLRGNWKADLDIHRGNVMKRADGTLVVIDPFAGG